jgi:protein MAK16
MQNDETIWSCIGNNGFCSFKVKVKTPPEVFCRNEHNVTGICSRVTCPLANSNYATVVEKEGICYLYMKTVERAHTPKNMWERVKLSRNFAEALQQIDSNLQFWPSHMINRVKQRLTRIRQTLIRMRKLSLRDRQVALVPVKQKTVRRERQREEKAEQAANVEKAVSEELLERLRRGNYAIYNYPSSIFNKAVDSLETEEPELVEEELNEEDYEHDIEDELGNMAFIEDSEEEEEEEEEVVRMKLVSKKKPRKLLEYEEDEDDLEIVSR